MSGKRGKKDVSNDRRTIGNGKYVWVRRDWPKTERSGRAAMTRPAFGQNTSD